MEKTTTNNLINKAIEYRSKESNFYDIWIVLDKDLVINFDEIIKNAEAKDMNIGWSNPCIEIWFAAYFGVMPNWQGSVECCKSFAKLFKDKTGKDYRKNSKTIYDDLKKFGDEDKAVLLAEEKLKQARKINDSPSKQIPASTLHYLINELKSK